MKNNLQKQQKAGLLLVLMFCSFSANTATYQNNNDFLKQESDVDNLLNDLNNTDETSKAGNQQQILALINQKKYNQALKEINKTITVIPNNAALYKLKAIIENLNNDKIAAEKSYLKVIDLDKNNLIAHEALSQLKFTSKAYDKAKEYAEKALKISPYSSISYQIIADLTLKSKGIAAAESFLLEARKNVSDNFKTEVSIIKTLNDIYSRNKQPKKQLSLAENLVSRYKKNSEALSLLSRALIINQKFDAAEKILRQLVLQHPNEGKHLLALAKFLGGQKGKEIETFELLERAEKKLKNPTLSLALKTTLQQQLKQYQPALNTANHIIKKFPGQSIGNILKGNVLFAQKKYASATIAYQEAYNMTPTISNIDLVLKGFAAQRKNEEAKSFLNQAVIKSPENPFLQLRLAEANHKTGDFQSAISLYKKLLSKKADDALVLNNLAWAYNGAKKTALALESSTKAYKIAPQLSAIADTYGTLLLANGENKEALSVLKQASAISPQLKEIQLHLAQAYIANDKQAEAKKILISLAKENSNVQAIATKLLEK